MNTDALRDNRTVIENWCKDNDISIFYGTIDENAATEVSWTGIINTDWEKYLAILKRTNTKILIIDIDINDIEITDEEILAYKEILEDQDYEDALKVIKKTNGQITSILLSFIHENVCYSYSQFATWYDEYIFIQDLFRDEEDDEETDSSTYERQPLTKQEEEIRKKVLELKAQKFTKQKIASTLNITMWTLNKFYDSENIHGN